MDTSNVTWKDKQDEAELMVEVKQKQKRSSFNLPFTQDHAEEGKFPNALNLPFEITDW